MMNRYKLRRERKTEVDIDKGNKQKEKANMIYI